MRNGMDAAMHRAVGAKVLHRRYLPALHRAHRLTDQFRYAFVFCRRDGDNGYAELLAHEFYIDGPAIFAHLVHHVQRNHHRNAQF
ncbi:hypothetical protein SDC9_130865 [bioreactor metagenome]|uniref:Uncharacterized protein n=1 Tax=bioreactor metagenome TaxID=1076179 RepID=A0A645D355_9ZZZZ